YIHLITLFLFFLILPPPPTSPLFPYTTLFRSVRGRSCYQVFGETEVRDHQGLSIRKWEALQMPSDLKGKSIIDIGCSEGFSFQIDRKSTRLNSSHVAISYAVFCLKKKKKKLKV